MFSCKFCKIFKSIYFYRTPPVAVSWIMLIFAEVLKTFFNQQLPTIFNIIVHVFNFVRIQFSIWSVPDLFLSVLVRQNKCVTHYLNIVRKKDKEK